MAGLLHGVFCLFKHFKICHLTESLKQLFSEGEQERYYHTISQTT